ncbi:MAG: TonB-dependent receptor plug domain-containing protein [Bacteroidales bacterium]|nr:TonB-dependent receptor plug domain-containing protein [Bacteroidales bacterium]
MRHTIHLVISLIFFGLLSTPGTMGSSAGEIGSVEVQTPYQKLVEFSRTFPQQKVYLHTDKSDYLAGEVIWLKSYLVSAHSHKPDTSSTNLFVELIDSRNELIDFLVLRLDGGLSDGYFKLPDSIQGGNYQIKAYTNWMNNFHEDFFFRKDVYVHNIDEKNYVTRAEIRRNTRFNNALNEKQENLQFAIFPEGGNLVAGLENRVAFKAANALGQGQQASGVVLDSQGNELASFTTFHDGMGVFAFSPGPNEKYTAQVVFQDGQKLSTELPPALTEVYLFQVDHDLDSIRVSVKVNFNPADFNISPKISILAHTRGRAVYVQEGEIINGVFRTSVPTEKFLPGITHFTVFGPNNTPLAERLVFVRRFVNQDEKPSIAFEKMLGDSLVMVDFWFDPENGPSVSEASYSLSVIEDRDNNSAEKINIATYLLLTSDFGKTIQNPWYYFADNSPERLQALDLLMLTHGWRRFVWNDLLSGNVPKITFGERDGLAIVGQVSPISSSRPTGELNIEMSVGTTEDRKIMQTKTDQNGRFAFTGLEYYGEFSALLSVERDIRGRIYKVELQTGEKGKSEFKLGPYTQLHQITSRGSNWQRRERPGFFSRFFDNKPTSQDVKSPSMFGNPDQVIFMEDLTVNYTNVIEILRDRVTGLNVIGGEITLRGPTSVMLSSEPVFFIDDVQVNRFSFLNVPISEIERIEVLRGPSTAILGSRGANGALLIYTRRAIHQQQFTYEYEMMGYHIPREFFISRIDVSKFEESQVPRTILWAPNITPDVNGRVRVRIPYYNGGQDLRFRLEGIDQNGQITFLQF